MTISHLCAVEQKPKYVSILKKNNKFREDFVIKKEDNLDVKSENNSDNDENNQNFASENVKTEETKTTLKNDEKNYGATSQIKLGKRC